MQRLCLARLSLFQFRSYSFLNYLNLCDEYGSFFTIHCQRPGFVICHLTGVDLSKEKISQLISKATGISPSKEKDDGKNIFLFNYHNLGEICCYNDDSMNVCLSISNHKNIKK